MKKGKVLSKGHFALVVMVFILGAAVWLNMKYSQKTAKYMGESALVSAPSQDDAAMVGTTPQEDYFTKAKNDREKAYQEAEEAVKEAINSAGSNENAVTAATEQAGRLAKRKTDEVAIENLLTAKGFNKTLAVIGDSDVTVVVDKGEITKQDTVQIQDVVMAQCNISVANIKIISVNG